MGKNMVAVLASEFNNKLGGALKRFLKFTLDVDIKVKILNKETIQKESIDNFNIVIVGLHDQLIIEGLSTKLMEYKTKIPFFIILGIEKKITDYDLLFLDGKSDDLLSPIRFLTHTCGLEYYRYFCLPDELFILADLLKKYKNKPLCFQNPFNDFPKKIEEIFKRFSSKEAFPDKEAFRYAIPEYRKKMRMKGFHDKPDNEENHLLEMQFYDLAVAYLKYKTRKTGKDANEDNSREFNVLVIENKPEGEIKELSLMHASSASNNKDKVTLNSCFLQIQELFDGYQFWIHEKDVPALNASKEELNSLLDNTKDRKEIEKNILKRINKLSSPNESPNKGSNDLSFKKIDLILIDIFLDEGANFSGLDFLRLFTILHPEIPAFILSGSEDTEVIGKTIKGKADYYILKKNIFSLPFIYYKYLDDLGALINYIEKPELKRNLIGNIRYWRFKKEFLWFGDKCYHMINHSFNHVENDWRIAHQVFIPILDHFGKDYFSDEGLYCFFMGIWLHDIGHKGNERYGEPHEIRDLHGLISAELILKHPEHYGIYGYNKPDSSPYRWLSFRHPRTAPQIIRERIASLEAAGRVLKQVDKKVNVEQPVQKLTILEKIALFCIYHKSNFPMDEEDLRNIVRKGKRIPRDCYENFNRSTSPIHLKSFSDLMGDQNLLQLMALFRFIDGLDINENRVGDETEEGVKKETIKRDLNYQLFKLKNDVSQLAGTHLGNSGKERRFISIFYDQVEKDIQEQQWISEDLKKEQRRFLDTLQVDVPLDNYYMLTEYIEFISVQDGHFDLHNSIHKLEIKDVLQGNGKLRFRIKYISRKQADILNDKDKVTVKERGQKEGRTIRDHLLGELEEKDGKKTKFRKNDGYVRRELNSVKEYLKDWFDLKNTKIYLHGSDKLYEERPKKTERPESD